ncbi:polysaccharide biosynthesis protein [Arcticibacterium luteifluviistationis]|uniref:Polysaccharide biosynthesis protein n=2 Tax=Arcticibacterium luteifluviistationis TaxID=1784714 RepID=A0A2Z4GEY8_9BACT|nr:polysaccharide biosynthesis protein [Arcticibacterium luteifluviistationis]
MRRLTKFTTNFVSKWLILVIDLLIVMASFTLSTLVKSNFNLEYIDPGLFKYHLVFVAFIRLLFFLIYSSFTGIVRHTSFEDAKVIIKAVFLSSLSLFVFSFSSFENWSVSLAVPSSILLIDFFILTFAMIASRFLVKLVYDRMIWSYKKEKYVIIYGSGHLGRITKNSLLNDKRYKYKILSFLDDNPQLRGKSIEGVVVYNKRDSLNEFITKNLSLYPDLELIFAIQSISLAERNEIIDEILETGVPLKVLPPIKQWMNGELKANQIHQVKIEDLLQRESIKLNNRLVSDYLKGKVIIITGAAGSIGSEIVRQALRFNPTKLILIDQAESPMYDIESELRRLKSVGNEVSMEFVLCNITDAKRIENLVKLYRPDVIFHAAAYKHVPLMEAEPYNAIHTNVLGTCCLADLALKYDVSRFVFVSTDKAVNPTNVMGASKRLAEMYIQSLSVQQNKTRFITTRFGNVLGSNGSVIPLFKRQIEAGGPVTVTDPDIIRYFMTIPEACQLVLEAGTMGKGGEIFVFEMGEPVKILNLAKRMIRLSGFKPDEEIEIKFTGLRPGEKLYEELLSDSERTKPTHHPKILIAQVKPNSLEDISREIDLLKNCLPTASRMDLVSILKRVIPEYKSRNSDYEILDNEKVSRKASLK